MGKLRVQRLMQKHGIQARGKRKFRVTTTDSRHDLPIAPNLSLAKTPPNWLLIRQLKHTFSAIGFDENGI